MEKRKQFFTPQQIDEQIEQRINGFQTTPETRFLTEMRQIARQTREKQELSLQRVEDRLMKHALIHVEDNAAPPVELRQRSNSSPTTRHERYRHMEKQQGSRFGQRVSILIAALVTTLLVSSLIAVLGLTHHKTTTAGPVKLPTPTSIPTQSGHFGKTLYTRNGLDGLNGLVWSPDSKRVATLTDKLQIWDATTGKHAIKVSLPGATLPNATLPFSAFGLTWSPNSQLIAIGTTQSLLVINGQNGTIVHTYPYSAASPSANASANSSLLSARIPTSGKGGFGTPVWSPDGKLIAVTVFETWNNKILVWNPQTNAVVFEITNATQGTRTDAWDGGGPVPSNIQDIRVSAWSSDGQYLAGMIYGTSDGSTPPINYVAAWSVSTHQLVFKHTLAPDAEQHGLNWQPHSDNLAFDTDSTFEIWNVLSGKQIEHYPLLLSNNTLTWSPNGKYIAYVSSSSISWVTIIEASTGQQVYTYKGHAQTNSDKHYITSLAWSPNGKYIASSEEDSLGLLKVWTAE